MVRLCIVEQQNMYFLLSQCHNGGNREQSGGRGRGDENHRLHDNNIFSGVLALNRIKNSPVKIVGIMFTHTHYTLTKYTDTQNHQQQRNQHLLTHRSKYRASPSSNPHHHRLLPAHRLPRTQTHPRSRRRKRKRCSVCRNRPRNCPIRGWR